MTGSSARPVLVEIVGVAGSGKSSLATLMCGAGGPAALADSLHTRKPSHLRYVVGGALRAVPVLSAAVSRSPRASWDEVKYLLYASEWHRYLRRVETGDRAMMVLDQGPLFAVARLETSDKPFTRTAAFARWRSAVLATWARTLDAVVVVDAPDRLLIDRINGRAQRHEAKGAPAESALRFFTRYRQAFEGILAELRSLNGPEVISFDTSRRAPSEMVDELAARFARAGSARAPLRPESRP